MYTVRCSNAGALFVSAACDGGLAELLPPPGPGPSRQADVLPLARLVRAPIELRGYAGRPGQQLLGVVALELAGGDSAVMLVLPHALADLASSRQFVRDWAAAASQLQTAAAGPQQVAAAAAPRSPRDAAERGLGGGSGEQPAFGWQRFDELADAGERLEAAMTPAALEELLPAAPGAAAGEAPPQQQQQPQAGRPAGARALQAGGGRRWWSAAAAWLLWPLVAVLQRLQVWASFYSSSAADGLQDALQALRAAGCAPPEPPCPGARVWPCTRLGSQRAERPCSGFGGGFGGGGGKAGRWRFKSHLASRFADPLKYWLGRASLLWHSQVLGAGDVLYHVSAARLAELKGQALGDLAAGGKARQPGAVQLVASSREAAAGEQPPPLAAASGPAAPPAVSTNDALVARIWQVGGAGRARPWLRACMPGCLARRCCLAGVCARRAAPLKRPAPPYAQALGGLPGKAGRRCAVYLAVDMRRRLPPRLLPPRSFGNWMVMLDTPWLAPAQHTLGALAVAVRRLVRGSVPRYQLECAAMRRKGREGGLANVFWRHLFWLPWSPMVVTNWDWQRGDADFGGGVELVWIAGGFNTPAAGVVKVMRALDGSGGAYVHFQVSGAAARELFATVGAL
jgi:hypothetical protein